jgi:hypothetical protein
MFGRGSRDVGIGNLTAARGDQVLHCQVSDDGPAPAAPAGNGQEPTPGGPRPGPPSTATGCGWSARSPTSSPSTTASPAPPPPPASPSARPGSAVACGTARQGIRTPHGCPPSRPSQRQLPGYLASNAGLALSRRGAGSACPGHPCRLTERSRPRRPPRGGPHSRSKKICDGWSRHSLSSRVVFLS